MENTESEDDEDVPIAYSHNDDGEEEDEDDEEPSDDDFSAPNPPLRGRGRGSGRGAGGRGAGGRGRGARANSAAWGRRSLTFHMPAFTAPTGPRPVPAALKDSHDVDLFLVDEFFVMLLKETNRRAYIEKASAAPPKLLSNWKDVTKDELYGLLSIVITMGLVQLPDEADYWNTDTRIWNVPLVSNVMARARFEQIKHCLMVANPTAEENEADKLAKVRPFLTLVQNVSVLRFTPSQDCSLDESQCQCGHRHARFAYRGETKKPIADYIKIISLHCAETGYCYSFFVDTREMSVRDMVLRVCSELPEGQPFRVATDRFYTGVDTAKALLQRGVFMYGTVRTDRGIDKTLKAELGVHPLEDGESRWSMADPHLLCCVWRDSTPTGCWFLSTCHEGKDATGEVRRRKRGQATVMKSAPDVAIEYNKYMGGCDRANSLRQSYNTYLTHKKRWYMSLFYYGLDVLLVNAFIFRNARAHDDQQQSHKKFRIEVATLFAGRALGGGAGADRVDYNTEKRRRTAADILPAIRLHPGAHLVVQTGHARICAWCYKSAKKQNKTVYMCKTCDLPLHPDCFEIFHDPHTEL